MASLLSSVPFAALLTYSPRGTSEVSVRSRRWRDAVKSARSPELERCALKLIELGGLEPFFGPGVTLVPAPRSAPTRDHGALWPARLICEVLAAKGLGREILPCLERTAAVPKSAFAAQGARPNPVVHFGSMAVASVLVPPERITVVDDVVTKGATLLAAASRLKEAFPSAEVRTFAILRTMGRVEKVERIVDPCQGTIDWDGSEAHRNPERRLRNRTGALPRRVRGAPEVAKQAEEGWALGSRPVLLGSLGLPATLYARAGETRVSDERGPGIHA